MDTRLSPKVGGLSAALAFVICAWLTPIQTYVWNRDESPTMILEAKDLLKTYDVIYDRLTPSGMPRYYFFGRMFFVIYALAAPCPFALRRARVIPFTRTGSIGYAMVFGGFVIGCIGDVGAYWGGHDTQTLTTLQGIGFGIETLAILAVGIGRILG